MDNADGNRRLTRYLLGELPEVEEKELETRYFDDEDLFEQLGAAETELVDAYVRGELTADERQKLENRFLQSDRGRRKLQFAQDFRQVASSHKGARRRTDPRIQGRKPPGSGPRPWGLRLLLPVAAAVVLGVLIFTLRAQRSTPDNSAHRNLAQVNTPAGKEQGGAPALARPSGVVPLLRPPVTGEGVIALTLNPGLLRDGGSSSTLALPPGAASIRLTLQLEFGVSGSFRAVLSTVEGHEIWRENGIRPAAGKPRTLVTDIPAGAVTEGDYVLTIASEAAGKFEDVADYYFRVIPGRDAAAK